MNTAYWLALLDRAVKTAGQAAILAIAADQVNALEIAWADVGGFALGGFILSVLTSLATTGILGKPSATTESVTRTTTRTVPRSEGGVADVWGVVIAVLLLLILLAVLGVLG